MKKCKRCDREVEESTEGLDNSAVRVRYGQTDIVVCYPCAVELTLLIGAWLGTEPPPYLKDEDVVEPSLFNDFFEKLAEYFDTGMWFAYAEGAFEDPELEEAKAILEVLQRIAEGRDE